MFLYTANILPRLSAENCSRPTTIIMFYILCLQDNALSSSVYVYHIHYKYNIIHNITALR